MQDLPYRSALMVTFIFVLASCTATQAPGTPPAGTPTTPPAGTPTTGDADGATPTEVEQELALPDSVLDAAREEGSVRIIDANEAEAMEGVIEAFNSRYPEITVEYQDAAAEVRTVRTLTEFKAGQNNWDIAGSLEGFIEDFKAEDALVPLNDLPAYANYEEPYRDPDDLWVAQSLVYWGTGYNTDAVDPADLPETWEDLTDPKWSGRIGMVDRPQLWAVQLWRAWGPERTTEFLEGVFGNDPSRRSESIDALSNLLAGGEFDIVIPAEPSTMETLSERGAPVAWHGPEPIPVAMSPLALLNDSPNPNAAKVYLNWFISQEGQAAFHESANIIPAHPALRDDEAYQGKYADQIRGGEVAVRLPDDEVELLPALLEVWQPFWLE